MTVNAATMTVPSVGILTARCHLTVTVNAVILPLTRRVTVTVIAVIPVLPRGFIYLGAITRAISLKRPMAIAGPHCHLGRVGKSGGGQGST